MFNEIEGGGSGGRSPPAEQGGLGGRRPPNDQCDKFQVRVYVPVKLLNVWITKIFLRLGYNLGSGCQVTISRLRPSYYPLARPSDCHERREISFGRRQ